MNQITRDIAKRLNIGLEEAVKVQDYMDENYDLRYSEISQAKLNRAIDEAYAELQSVGA